MLKAFAAHDGTLYDETYNLLNAWLAVIPGNSAYNMRRLALLNTNVADLSFLFTLDTGQRTNSHLQGREYLAVFETPHQTPYFWNLHVDDVSHTLVTGATGAGKSFLVNFIVTHAQKYDPVTTIFDLGGSYQNSRPYSVAARGTWPVPGTSINRLSGPTPEHLLLVFIRARPPAIQWACSFR